MNAGHGPGPSRWTGWTDALELSPLDEVFLGRCLAGRGTRIFGGHLVGHALLVAARSARSSGMQPLAVDTHFLTAGDAGSPVEYRPLALRTGRSFEHWRVDACQGATPVASNVVVLHLPEHGPEHALREAATLGVVQRDAAQQLLVPGADATILDGFDVRAVTSLPADHSPLPRRRMELRTRDELPDHPATWAAVIAWASELAIAGTPDLRLRERTTRRIAASLDHVIQFHVDVDVRDWMPYDMTSTRLAHGRAFAEGGMFVDGALGASVSQELLMRLELDAATRLDPG